MTDNDETQDNPMQTTSLDPHTEDTISTDLARANLARLRGDYGTAEELCTALLQKAPHNANDAALLGDISVEQEKLEAAVQWYGMAVDSGAPIGITEKLELTRDRLRKNEAEASEAGIGLPSRTAFSPATLLGITVVVLMLLVGAYVAGTSRPPSTSPPTQDQSPIQIPASTSSAGGNTLAQQSTASSSVTPTKSDIPPTESTNAPTETHQTSPATQKLSADSDLVPFLGDAPAPLSRITAAASDPRTHIITLDAPLQPGDEARAVAAQIAEAALARLKDAPTVTIRLLDIGKPVFVADASREKYDAYVKTGRAAASGNELADALLLNEWKVGSEATATGR